MSKYKVGDVAALFSKPKDPTTDAGKKLQFLFEDFYSKNKKSTFKKSQDATELNESAESKETANQSISKKSKKRKFSSLNDTEQNSENVSVKKFKKSFEQLEESKSNEQNENKKRNKFVGQQDFPRKKKKKTNVNSTNANSSFPKFEAHINSENEFKSSATFNKKNGPKRNTQNRSFIKKSKLQNFGKKASDKITDDSFDASDALLRKEVKDFMNSNSEKKEIKNSIEFKKKPEKKAFSWEKQNSARRQQKKSNFSSKNSFNYEESFEQEEKCETNKRRIESNGFKDQVFPRTKKGPKVNSLNFNNSISKPAVCSNFEDNCESPKKVKNVDGNVKKKSQMKKFNVASALTDDSPPKNDNEIRKNHKRNFSMKIEKGKTQNKKIGKGNREKSEKIHSKNIFENNHTSIRSEQADHANINTTFKNKIGEGNQEKSEKIHSKNIFQNNHTLIRSQQDHANINTMFKKKKFSQNNLIQSSQIIGFEQGAPDFIKVPSQVDDELDRTLFVGNLPMKTKKKDLKRLFSTFGPVVLVRLIGVETDKAKIFNRKAPKLLNVNHAVDSVTGYVTYKIKEDASDALKLSGALFKGHHITVNFALAPGTKKLYDDKRSIFIGNLPFATTDESIWDAFTSCGVIEGVRVVRDKETGIGKGFGYVQFRTFQGKENALAMKELHINGREIRIKAIDSSKKPQKTDSSHITRDTFKSRAFRLRKYNKSTSSRKSIKKLTNKVKILHKKKRIASGLLKSMK